MASNITRMPQQQMIADPATQWTWNGSQWVCGCDDFPPCPPGQFPPTAPPWFPPPPQQPPWYPGANAGVSFSATPPPNPIRGNFWWDGVTLWMFDGAAWVPVGGGAPGTAPGGLSTTTEVFSITGATVGAQPVDKWTIAPISGVPSINMGGAWNSSTHTWTASVPGVYGFTITGVGDGSPNYAITLLKNDNGGPYTDPIQNVEQPATVETGDASYITAFGLCRMNGTTDFIRLWFFSGAGSYSSALGIPDIVGWKFP